MIAVDAAHWWGPVGYLYRQTTGNLIASGIAFTAGFLAGHGPVKHVLSEFREHQKWSAQHLAEVNAVVTGTPAAPHPKHGTLTPPAITSLEKRPVRRPPKRT